MKALRVQVERVVRPLRASQARKDRIREELLAHLTRQYEDELARTGNPELATAEAIRRFGSAPELTTELQASVARLERWASYSFPNSGPIRRRVGESPLKYLCRMNCWAGAFGVAFFALFAMVIMIIINLRPHRAHQLSSGQLLLFCLGAAVLEFVGMIGPALLSEGIRQQLERRAIAESAIERLRAIWWICGYAATIAILFGCIAAGFMLVMETMMSPHFPIGPWRFWGIICGVAALGVPLVLKQAQDWRAKTIRFDNWESLDLNEPSPSG